MKGRRRLPEHHDHKNIVYLKSLFGKKMVKEFWRVATKVHPVDYDSLPSDYKQSYELVGECLNFMKKFGGNRWWWSQNEQELVVNCLKYNWIAIGFPKFQRYAERMLGHGVSHLSFAFGRTELLEEAEHICKAS